MNKYSN